MLPVHNTCLTLFRSSLTKLRTISPSINAQCRYLFLKSNNSRLVHVKTTLESTFVNRIRNNSLLSPYKRKNPKFEQIRQNHDESSKSYNERVKNMGQNFGSHVSKSNLQMRRVLLVLVAFIFGPQLFDYIFHRQDKADENKAYERISKQNKGEIKSFVLDDS